MSPTGVFSLKSFVFSVEIPTVKQGKEDDVGQQQQHPGYGEAEIQIGIGGEGRVDPLHPNHSESENTEDGGKGADGGIAKALNGVSQDTVGSGNTVERRDEEHINPSVVDGIGVFKAHQKSHPEVTCEKHGDADDGTARDRHPKGVEDGLFDTVMLSGTKVLTDKDVGGGGKGTVDGTDYAIQMCSGAMSRNGGRAEEVSGGLNLQIGQGIENTGNGKGKSHAEDQAEGRGIPSHELGVQTADTV